MALKLTGQVYRIDSSGRRIETVATFTSLLENPAAAEGPADIAIDRQRDRLLVPLFRANTRDRGTADRSSLKRDASKSETVMSYKRGMLELRVQKNVIAGAAGRAP